MVAVRLGSLCSGAGGLDLAVETVFGAETVWHCEIDSAASKVLADRWPDVPNYGDVGTVNWARVAPIDVLVGGYPCQPFSRAGRRQGVADERHIWPVVREAIRRLRPRYTVLENVAGHRSLGFGRVLGDLAEDGLHVRWTSLRACDVGACHQRERLFILVTDPARDGWARFNGGTGGAPTRGGWEREPAGSVGAGAGLVALLPTPAAVRSGRNQSPSPGAAVRPSLDMITDLLPTPSAVDGRSGELLLPGIVRTLLPPQLIDYVLAPEQWGKYAPAIHRWEQLTRPAPPPTELNSRGNPRLNPAFSEWMMGWPAGWVTDVKGVSRNDQLRVIGNGVVPQCAAAALSWLMSLEVVA